jgi:hypothetical protein
LQDFLICNRDVDSGAAAAGVAVAARQRPVRQATKKTTFLRVKSAHFYALKKQFFCIKSRVVNSKSCFNHFSLNGKFFLTRKNVRFLRVNTSFFCCLSDWAAGFFSSPSRQLF